VGKTLVENQLAEIAVGNDEDPLLLPRDRQYVFIRQAGRVEIVSHLPKSAQWPHMVVIITYDENGGFWDHVAPPKGDRWGPGSRIPALIVSPYAKKGFVDHTLYDTTSILRFITRRFDLPPLPGLRTRDAAFAAHGSLPLGDLTGALDLRP
jgi:acid phosphatase